MAYVVVHFIRTPSTGDDPWDSPSQEFGRLGPYSTRADAEAAAFNAASAHDLPEEKADCRNEEQGYWWGRDRHEPAVLHIYVIDTA
jgi:hypothetical protein